MKDVNSAERAIYGRLSYLSTSRGFSSHKKAVAHENKLHKQGKDGNKDCLLIEEEQKEGSSSARKL